MNKTPDLFDSIIASMTLIESCGNAIDGIVLNTLDAIKIESDHNLQRVNGVLRINGVYVSETDILETGKSILSYKKNE